MRWIYGGVVLAVLSNTACGLPTGFGFGDVADGVEIDLTLPAAGAIGTVISAGFIPVSATEGIVFGRFRVEAELSGDIGSANGQILIFALRDATQPWLNCIGGSVDDGCTIVISRDDADEGFISLRAPTRKMTLFLESNFELGEAPGLGCTAFLIGGAALQWHVPLTEDLVPGSAVVIDLSMRRSRAPAITIGWQLLLADPPGDLPGDQVTTSCN